MTPFPLSSVAFGAHPGADVDDPAVVAAATDLDDLCLRGIALAAQGRYARARYDLTEVLRRSRGARCVTRRAVAATALASCRRQTGGHGWAAAADGSALAMLAGDGARDDDPRRLSTRLDATIGLAADHLGTGDLSASDRLLARVEDSIRDGGHLGREWWISDRPHLRAAWVRAEWHLYRGDARGALAVAERASALLDECPSLRHRLKTQVLLAACQSTTGDLERAVSTALDAARRATELGQLPLLWAVAGLLCDVGGANGDAAGRAIWTARRDDTYRTLIARGAQFSVDTV
ncbi:hypothetical protein [Williamsia deligens]|uniref:Uncharacterized protein n=1 Tax=Williamsia deligens TaxID=321325 RepID=A0ABW3G8R3_9NOCA|nr:hypothetical protein [Williamsia deligens]MCP2192374.1 hypothetical protein [Williamsia deligens]